MHIYDDGSITVVSPSVLAAVGVSSRTEVSGTYTADFISGATPVLSVDAVSSATHINEERHQVGLSVTQGVFDLDSVTASYAVSLEGDHETHAPSIVYATELFDRRVRASLSYRLSIEQLERSDEPGFSQRSLAHEVAVEWIHILGPATVVSVVGSGFVNSCEAELGCQANPYRYVPVAITNAAGLQGRIALRERHPDLRAGGAATVRLSRSLAHDWALHLGYQFWADSWDVIGNALEASVATTALSEHLELRGELRGSLQSDTSFYREGYEARGDTTPAYRTLDSELAGLQSLRAGIRGEWTQWSLGPFDQIRFSARLAHGWFHYPDYGPRSRRNVWIVGAGVDVDL